MTQFTKNDSNDTINSFPSWNLERVAMILTSDVAENSRSREFLARQPILPRTRFSILENFWSRISRHSRFSKITGREVRFIA